MLGVKSGTWEIFCEPYLAKILIFTIEVLDPNRICFIDITNFITNYPNVSCNATSSISVLSEEGILFSESSYCFCYVFITLRMSVHISCTNVLLMFPPFVYKLFANFFLLFSCFSCTLFPGWNSLWYLSELNYPLDCPYYSEFFELQSLNAEEKCRIDLCC